MSNMSYCRFENTLNDLRDCRKALQELFESEDKQLSEYESDAAMALIEECESIMQLVADTTDYETCFTKRSPK